MSGTTFTAKFDRVVDGDTIRVFLNEDDAKSESLRILALDTEEKNPGSKPVTPLGRLASERAEALFAGAETVRITLPGAEPKEIGLTKYRGNFGRILCYVELPDGRDFQEVMIREGLSPYFQKYGYAHSGPRHIRYIAAERAAQAEGLGIWDQISNNGQEMRNYAALGTWWDLRARVIEGYREIKRRAPEVNMFNTRLDYDRLVQIAKARQETTVFMELRDFSPTSGDHVLFNTGSIAQPFQLFVPDGNTDAGAELMRFLLTRYVAEGEERPRRSYAYVTGATKMYPDNETGRPEIVVTEIDQITDWPDVALERAVSTIPRPLTS